MMLVLQCFAIGFMFWLSFVNIFWFVSHICVSNRAIIHFFVGSLFRCFRAMIIFFNVISLVFHIIFWNNRSIDLFLFVHFELIFNFLPIDLFLVINFVVVNEVFSVLLSINLWSFLFIWPNAVRMKSWL